MKLNPLSVLECRNGSIKLPNTTIISLYARYNFTTFISESEFNDCVNIFTEDLQAKLRKQKTVKINTGKYWLTLSVPRRSKVSLGATHISLEELKRLKEKYS